jgi:hypothetical protein
MVGGSVLSTLVRIRCRVHVRSLLCVCVVFNAPCYALRIGLVAAACPCHTSDIRVVRKGRDRVLYWYVSLKLNYNANRGQYYN